MTASKRREVMRRALLVGEAGGHEQVETTQIYLDADLAMKERVLARTAPPHAGASRFRPKDALLAFLEGL